MIEVKSPAFSEGDEVPTQFTCDGENISPPLRWSGVPEEAAELRVSLTDPDAPRGPFTHWLVTGVGPARHRAGDPGAGGRDRADERLRRDDVRRAVSATRVSSSLCLHR